MPGEGKPCWGWVHVVSLVIALALHAMAFYVVGGLFRKPTPETKPFTVVVRMQKAAPTPDPIGLASGAQQGSGAQPTVTKSPKRLHHAIPSESLKGIEPPEPTSSTSSVTSAPSALKPIDSETSRSESPPSPPGLSTEVAVRSDLAFFCPVHPAPVYPRISRKLGEEGTVMLNVEWNQKGRITLARVQKSSGYSRLDQAALAAIDSWRCNPAEQDGVPVRAVAVQPFSFQLQED